MPENVRSLKESPKGKQSLTPLQARLIELLLDGTTITAAAILLHVNEKTCRRWLKLAHVDEAFQQAKEENYHKALGMLRRSSLATLKKHLDAPVKPTAGSQIRAVQIVHDLDRITELEHLVAEYELRLKYPWHGGEEYRDDDE